VNGRHCRQPRCQAVSHVCLFAPLTVPSSLTFASPARVRPTSSCASGRGCDTRCQRRCSWCTARRDSRHRIALCGHGKLLEMTVSIDLFILSTSVPRLVWIVTVASAHIYVAIDIHRVTWTLRAHLLSHALLARCRRKDGCICAWAAAVLLRVSAASLVMDAVGWRGTYGTALLLGCATSGGGGGGAEEFMKLCSPDIL
jgi:hypothetical protein